jgi:hypothetical protein
VSPLLNDAVLAVSMIELLLLLSLEFGTVIALFSDVSTVLRVSIAAILGF